MSVTRQEVGESSKFYTVFKGSQRGCSAEIRKDVIPDGWSSTVFMIY
jgi:hypothetical protein